MRVRVAAAVGLVAVGMAYHHQDHHHRGRRLLSVLQLLWVRLCLSLLVLASLLSLRLLISPLLIFQISFQSRSPLLLRLALRIECIDLLSEVSVFLWQRWNRDSVPVSCSCIQGGHR